MDATDWPVPGTAWRTLHLDAPPSGSAQSVNDGTLALERARRQARRSPAPTVPSNTFATDPYTTATVTIDPADEPHRGDVADLHHAAA